MANNMNEGLEAEGSRADHALRIKTPAGTEISTNDKWTARIIVTTAGVAGIVAVGGVTKFCLDQPQVVEKAVEVALKIWGEVSSIKFGSVIIELDCGSEEKLLQFLDDFENGNVKAALEKEFRERGYNSEQDLLVTLDKKALPKAILIRRTMHSITEEKVMVQNLNPFVTAVEKDRKYKPECGADIQQNPIDEGPSYPPPKRQKVDKEVTKIKNISSAHSSSTHPSVNFKDGVPPDDVLEKLGKKIGSDWRPLGRRLGFEDEELDELEEAHKHLSQKSYQMLKKWKRRKCDEATSLYIILYEALSHEFVGRRDLAGEYCTEKK